MKTMAEVVSTAINEFIANAEAEDSTGWSPLQMAMINDEKLITVVVSMLTNAINPIAYMLVFADDQKLRDIIRVAMVIAFETGRLVERHGVVEQAEEKCQ